MSTLTRRAIIVGAAGAAGAMAAPRARARRIGRRALPSSSSCRIRRAGRPTSSRGWCSRGCSSGSARPSSSRTSRRFRQRRHRAGGEVAARRQHLADRVRQPCRQSVRAAEPAVRHREGPRPGAADRHRALSWSPTNPAKPYKIARRRHRRGEGQARYRQLWLGRQRQHRPSRHGAARQAGRRVDGARALSRRRAGHERRHRRPCRSR